MGDAVALMLRSSLYSAKWKIFTIKIIIIIVRERCCIGQVAQNAPLGE